MSQPPYGGYPNQGDPYGPEDPYNRPPTENIPGWTPAPTQGGGSGYQPVNQDPYGQQNPYGQQDPYGQQPDPYSQPDQYNHDPYAQQPTYGQPGYGQQYGGNQPPPAPPKKSQLPWIITAIIAVLGVGAAVLIIVLNKGDSTPVAGGSGSQSTAPSVSAGPSVPEPSDPPSSTPKSDPPSSSASAPAPTTDSLQTQAEEMFTRMAKQDKSSINIYVCAAWKDAFDKEWTDGKWKQFADSEFTVTDAKLNDDPKTGIVEVDIKTPTVSGSANWPMSYIGKYWYYCPADQPDVTIINK